MNGGATIHEMNVVRKHTSRIQGGQFAKLAYPATVVSLIFSDVPGDDMGTIASGPTVPDTSTAENAAALFAKNTQERGRLIPTRNFWRKSTILHPCQDTTSARRPRISSCAANAAWCHSSSARSTRASTPLLTSTRSTKQVAYYFPVQ